MNNLTILYIFIASLTILNFVIIDIKSKRPSIVSIYITIKIIFFSLILVVINALNIEFVLKVVLSIFIVWLDINFCINSIINLLYKIEQKINNILLEVIYIIISIIVIILNIKLF